jgi:hypothetical protein
VFCLVSHLLWQLHEYLKQWGLLSGVVTVACGTLSALRYAVDLQSYPSISGNLPDFDVLMSIRRCLLPGITYQWHHVIGHQDRIDFLARVNIQVDNMAGAARTHFSADGSASIMTADLPHESWRLFLTCIKVCTPIHSTIQHYISCRTMREYWHRKQRIQEHSFASVDWAIIGLAMRQTAPSRRSWITKHASNSCGVNVNLVRWNQKESTKCPRCGEEETNKHVWKYQQPEAVKVWEKEIDSLRQWLSYTDTETSIIESMCSGLLQWQGSRFIDNDSCEAGKFQDELGWDLVIEGCLGVQWRLSQQNYFTTIGSKRSGLRWGCALVLRLWEVAWDMRTHRNEFEHEVNSELEDIRLTNDIAHQQIIIQSSDQLQRDLGAIASEKEMARPSRVSLHIRRHGSETSTLQWLG